MTDSLFDRGWLEELILESLEGSDIGDSEEEQMKALDGIMNKMPEMIQSYEKSLKRVSGDILKENSIELSSFKDRLRNRWKKAFDQLEFFIFYNSEFGRSISDSYSEKNIYNVKLGVLLQLHARSCQISLEIFTLINNGFADGAQARWRSLYELSVLANFLEERDEELCQRYLDYFFVENFHETLEYQKNCEALGQVRLSDSAIREANSRISELKDRYGDKFIKPYGWIGDALPKNKWNFAGMEATVHFKFMRSYYKMSNNSIHSGAKGFIFKLGAFSNQNIMLTGPTNYGFADPGQNTAYCLLELSKTLTGFEASIEDVLFLKVAKNMFDKLALDFVKIQKEIEKEEKEREN